MLGVNSDQFCSEAFQSLQVAEERALAGMCGNPRCSNGLLKQKPSAHYKVQGRVVYNMEDELSIACR